jgi:hypothetical protein
VQLIASHHVVRRMIGPDFDHLERDCRVLLRSHEDPDPARFDDREWLTSLYTEDGQTIYALLHLEYQGNRHRGRCPSREYRPCWYNAIGLAVSTDGGDSYHHAEPPAHLVASAPYPYRRGRGPYGIFSPRNVVRDPRDGYLYVLFRTEPHQALRRGVSVMRTRSLEDPDSWRAWGGRAFDVAFVDPYTAEGFRPEDHVPQPIAPASLGNMGASLTWNTHLGRWLLIGNALGPGTGAASPPGVYYSLSDDLLRWTPRRLLFPAQVFETWSPGDPDPINYPSAIDHASESRTFGTTGRSFFVYFTLLHGAGRGDTRLDRDLVRVPVEIAGGRPSG